MLAWSCDWVLFCLCVKIFVPSILNSVDFWNSMSLVLLDLELTEKEIFKELGLFLMAPEKDFHVLHQELINLKPNKQTTWNKFHLHGNPWNSGKRDYDKLFAVSDNIKLMKAEVFAEGLEKLGLLTRLLGQNVENLDDYGYPKIQEFKICWRRKTDSSWISSSYYFRHETRLLCAKRKVKVYGERAMHQLDLYLFCVFLYVFIVIVFTTT